MTIEGQKLISKIAAQEIFDSMVDPKDTNNKHRANINKGFNYCARYMLKLAEQGRTPLELSAELEVAWIDRVDAANGNVNREQVADGFYLALEVFQDKTQI